VAERRALLLVPVDPPLRRVDVDERQHAGAGQQVGAAGQLRQQLPADLAELEHVAPGERPQERPHGRRRPQPGEHDAHRAVPQHVHIIDRVSARGHACDQAPDLRLRVGPARAADADVPAGQGTQARPLGQRQHRDQPGQRHKIRVIEPHRGLQRIMRQSHLSGVLSNPGLEASSLPSSQFRGHLSFRRAPVSHISRWIEA
jgi:hypothetical protein